MTSARASTGPRPRGRGMPRAKIPTSATPQGASTGPRPRGRGMIASGAQGHCNGVGFNGAAPARARNGWLSGSGHDEHPRRFNGAAPARARNVVRGLAQSAANACLASTGPRPRGRGMRSSRQKPGYRRCRFNGAAPARARNVRACAIALNRMPGASTGPRPRGRGMVANRQRPSSLSQKLQRGRARAGAEWRYGN